jgi:hypothetical protein
MARVFAGNVRITGPWPCALASVWHIARIIRRNISFASLVKISLQILDDPTPDLYRRMCIESRICCGHKEGLFEVELEYDQAICST